MAGNFISRAVLSIFMDKAAREKYTAIQDAKRDVRAGKKPKPTSKPASEADGDNDFDVLPETLIQQAIDAASEELERKKNIPPGRQALIEQALTIQDQQRKVFDDLPKEQREKLQVMAMHVFGGDMDAKQNGNKKKAREKIGKNREPS